MGQPAIRLVSVLPGRADPGEILIFCPFLAGLDPALGMWLGPLAWHDCNATLLAALEARAAPPGATVFAGVFCTDPFRLDDDILGALRAAGVVGVANLPSVSFLDGEFGQTLAALNLGVERELAFLRKASSRGFRVAGCVRGLAQAEALRAAGAELIISHAGPPIGQTAGPRPRRGRLPDIGFTALSELLGAISEHQPARSERLSRITGSIPSA